MPRRASPCCPAAATYCSILRAAAAAVAGCAIQSCEALIRRLCCIARARHLAGAPYSVLLLLLPPPQLPPALLPCLAPPPVLNSLLLPQLVLYSCARRSLLAELYSCAQRGVLPAAPPVLYSCARRNLLAVLYKRARRGACKSTLYSTAWRSAGATLASPSCLAWRGTLLALPSLCSIAGRGAALTS